MKRKTRVDRRIRIAAHSYDFCSLRIGDEEMVISASDLSSLGVPPVVGAELQLVRCSPHDARSFPVVHNPRGTHAWACFGASNRRLLCIRGRRALGIRMKAGEVRWYRLEVVS